MSGKRNKNKNEKKKKTQEVSLEKSVSNSEDYSKTIEIREKRIGIVFKVIYVIAIFFAAMMAVLAPNMGTGITETYLMAACAAAFLLMMLYYMVAYIINEMMCLRLYADDLPQKQIAHTEKSYSMIFKGFAMSGAFSVLCFILGIYIKNYISATVLGIAFTALIFVGTILMVVQMFLKDKKSNVISCINCIVATVALVCMFLIPAFSSAVETAI